MDISIRKLEKRDFSFVVPLLQQLSSFELREEVSSLQFELFVEHLSSSRNHSVYVLEKEGVVIACITLIIEPKIIHSFGKILRIEDFVVEEEYRGAGYGKHLLDFAKKFGKENGCYSISLVSSAKNIPFYSKSKFYQKGNFEMRFDISPDEN